MDVPVLRIQELAPYSWRKRAISCESDNPLDRKTLICDKNIDNSSYKPISFPWLSAIIAPIFSKDWSSSHQEGSFSVKLHCFRLVSTSDLRNLQRADLPLPVGMQIAIQSNTGSTQSVPSTCTVEWDIAKLTVRSSPAKTAMGGILIALPTCWHP